MNLDNLPAGTYSVIVNDGLCQPLDAIGGIELLAPPEILSLEIVQIDSVSCNGLSDGSMLAEFSGGLPANWNWALYSTTEEGMSSSYDQLVDVLVDFGVNLFEPQEIFIDNLSTGYENNLPKGIEFIFGDCQDDKSIMEQIKASFDIYPSIGLIKRRPKRQFVIASVLITSLITYFSTKELIAMSSRDSDDELYVFQY